MGCPPNQSGTTGTVGVIGPVGVPECPPAPAEPCISPCCNYFDVEMGPNFILSAGGPFCLPDPPAGFCTTGCPPPFCVPALPTEAGVLSDIICLDLPVGTYEIHARGTLRGAFPGARLVFLYRPDCDSAEGEIIIADCGLPCTPGGGSGELIPGFAIGAAIPSTAFPLRSAASPSTVTMPQAPLSAKAAAAQANKMAASTVIANRQFATAQILAAQHTPVHLAAQQLQALVALAIFEPPAGSETLSCCCQISVFNPGCRPGIRVLAFQGCTPDGLLVSPLDCPLPTGCTGAVPPFVPPPMGLLPGQLAPDPAFIVCSFLENVQIKALRLSSRDLINCSGSPLVTAAASAPVPTVCEEDTTIPAITCYGPCGPVGCSTSPCPASPCNPDIFVQFNEPVIIPPGAVVLCSGPCTDTDPSCPPGTDIPITTTFDPITNILRICPVTQLCSTTETGIIEYCVKINMAAITDCCGNVDPTGFFSYSFTVDCSCCTTPALVSSDPASEAIDVPVDTDITMTFECPVSVIGDGGAPCPSSPCTCTGGDCTYVLEPVGAGLCSAAVPTGPALSGVITGSGTDTIVFNPDADLAAATRYRVTMVADPECGDVPSVQFQFCFTTA